MPFNFNQTNFEHTFQAKVTFLSNTFFGGEGIDISKNTKLDVNGTANFLSKSVFADVDVKNLNITSGANITGLTTFNNIDIDGELRDGDGDFGSAGQVLSSDGTDTKWVNAGSLSAGVAAQVSVSDDGDSNASRFVTFVDAASGSNAIKTDASIKYNPSSNQLSAGSFSGSIDASNVDSGTLGADRIPNLDAGKITTGTLGTGRIPNLDAGKITTGTLGSGRIPNLDAGKITTGTLDDARIPSLNASKINAGTFATARIPDLSGAKITTGTVAVERLGSGTPSSSNFLRGDGAWTSISFPDGDKITEGNTEAEVVDTGTNGHFKVTTEGTERLRITSAGLVGIGTDDPNSMGRLSVVVPSTGGHGAINIQNHERGTGKTNIVMRSLDNNGGNWADAEFRAEAYSFKIRTTERFRFGFSGQLGINVPNGTVNYGTEGQVLKSQGANAAVEWQTAGMSHSSKTSAYTLTASDDNRLITTTSNITVPSNVFSAANGTTIYNNSSSNITITPASGVTLRLSGSNITGTRTLAQRGVCTILCVASNEFIITGSGLA